MQKLRTDLIRELRRVADPARAKGAQAYMKSEMPFLGIAAVPLREVCKRTFAAHPLPDAATWRKTILALWRKAKYREERYAAIGLSGSKLYRQFQDLDALPMYEEMIVTGAWWDYVDGLAIHRVGAYLLRDYPAKMKKTMRRWSVDDDMWKRRTSILCQITFKKDTDLDLLYDCIRPSLSSRDISASTSYHAPTSALPT